MYNTVCLTLQMGLQGKPRDLAVPTWAGMFPVAAFYACTLLAGQPLRIDIASPALDLFSMLETSLRIHTLERPTRVILLR